MQEDMRGKARERTITALVVAVGTAVVWLLWDDVAPTQLLVGTEPMGVEVPTQYTACVFPAFFAFASALGWDVWNRRAKETWVARTLLLLLTSTLAVVRLSGALPLSGHGLFLSSVLMFEWGGTRRSRMTLVLAMCGFAITAYYKVVVWQDTAWFLVSVMVGLVLGLAATLLGRLSGPRKHDGGFLKR